MSQHDFDIANQGFPATRADINNAFQAIASNSSGPTAPSTTYANMWWYDTTNNKMYLRNEADSAWIEVATIDQTNNEWQITTGSIQAADSDGLRLKTDDGTTRLFIKDSNGDVGIGTGSPNARLEVADDSEDLQMRIGSLTAGIDPRLRFQGRNVADTTSRYCDIQLDADNDSFTIFAPSGSTPLNKVLNIDTSGNFGIGTDSPSVKLHQIRSGSAGDLPTLSSETGFITQSTNAAASSQNISIISGNLGQGRLYFGDTDDENQGYIIYDHSGNRMSFATNGSLAVRIDSDGNLLVGTTSSPSSGQIEGIKTFDGGAVGDSRSGIYFGLNGINPTVDLELSDNTRDIGGASFRWDDVYATNGTIQTSDQNEKQQIASLTDAEITAAKAISKLFKTFKWNDSVAEKGDAARTHTGVIAQEVETAMTDAGLNAGDYAFFISTTWWETQTEVPAVEAVDAVYETVTIPAVEEEVDEEGNVIVEAQPETTEQRLVSEAVEAREAYTRTDTYDTAEEAPEGATERNRKGIRYPQLLSFIGAATEQRLASIESRLDALEA